jgi:hypothetical protein
LLATPLHFFPEERDLVNKGDPQPESEDSRSRMLRSPLGYG